MESRIKRKYSAMNGDRYRERACALASEVMIDRSTRSPDGYPFNSHGRRASKTKIIIAIRLCKSFSELSPPLFIMPAINAADDREYVNARPER